MTSIEKFYNPEVFHNFKEELQRNLKRYPDRSIWDMVKLLFVGTRSTDPLIVLMKKLSSNPLLAIVPNMCGKLI